MENPYNWDKIVFFDGVCILCNRSVDFLLKRDKKKRLKFASMQSDSARDFLFQKHQEPFKEDTIIFYYHGQFLVKSDAVLKIAATLGFPYSSSLVFKIIPRKWRDRIYDYIARNRFKWFGTYDNCRVPDDETRGRIIG